MKLCIDVYTGIEYDELLPMISKLGFDGFFSREDFCTDYKKIAECRRLADENHLLYETAHCSIPGDTTIWLEGPEGDEYIKTLLVCVDHCAAFHIPTLIVHVAADYRQPVSFDRGAKRLRTVVDYAYKKGVRIAFENVGASEFLFNTLDYFQDEHVGFCYDTGHNFFCCPDVDVLGEVGHRLVCTHFHDNDGTKDQHLIPFDGKIDFEKVCEKLRSLDYKGNLTLEIYYKGPHDERYEKFGGPYGDRYSKMEFLQRCKDSLVKLRDMIGG